MDTADTKKEQERARLHRIIWEIANDLRGSVDGWDSKGIDSRTGKLNKIYTKLRSLA